MSSVSHREVPKYFWWKTFGRKGLIKPTHLKRSTNPLVVPKKLASKRKRREGSIYYIIAVRANSRRSGHCPRCSRRVSSAPLAVVEEDEIKKGMSGANSRDDKFARELSGLQVGRRLEEKCGRGRGRGRIDGDRAARGGGTDIFVVFRWIWMPVEN